MRKGVLLVIAIAVAATGWSLLGAKPVATVTFFDVGQGDAALVAVGRTQVLVDGGPDRAVLNGLGSSMPMLDRQIEYVVLSHPHTDHYRGLVDVFKRYKVKTLIIGIPGEEQEYQAFEKLAESSGTRIVQAGGQTINLASSAKFQIIFPQSPWPDQPVEHPNDSSVVAIGEFGITKILFSGDAEAREEAQIVRSGTSLDVNILKVGHHGSRTSSNPKLLEAASPEVSVISVGKDNRYGHPTPITLQNLTNAGGKVIRTDQQGAVTVTLTKRGYLLTTEK